MDGKPAGEVAQLTMTEAHNWDIPREVMLGGDEGWPKIISGLKSLLETGKPLTLTVTDSRFDLSHGEQ